MLLALRRFYEEQCSLGIQCFAILSSQQFKEAVGKQVVCKARESRYSDVVESACAVNVIDI